MEEATAAEAVVRTKAHDDDGGDARADGLSGAHIHTYVRALCTKHNK